MSQYNMAIGRTPEQIAKMKIFQEKGICAFCPESFEEYHDHPIEFETDHWIVTKNDYPYEHTSLHLLLVAKSHVLKLHELSVEARIDLMEAIAAIEQKFALDGYAVGMRVGDPRLTGGSVAHLHAHVIVGDGGDELVLFEMSSRPR
jgi:ATP adenylyltransferase